MATRSIVLEHYGPLTISSGQYLPFTTSPHTHWPQDGQYAITVIDNCQLQVPYTSQNDYLCTWLVSLSNATFAGPTMMGLEYNYGGRIRTDYIMSPIKTNIIANSSIYHLQYTRTEQDTLLIGLKLIGPVGSQYTLYADSDSWINASLTLLAL